VRGTFKRIHRIEENTVSILPNCQDKIDETVEACSYTNSERVRFNVLSDA